MNKIKMFGAVTILALSISSLGVAFAAPDQHQSPNTPAVQRQAVQMNLPNAAGVHNPADMVQHQKSVATVDGEQQKAVVGHHQAQNNTMAARHDAMSTGQAAARHRAGMNDGNNNANNAMHGYGQHNLQSDK